MKNAVMATVTTVWTVYMLIGAGKWLFAGEPFPDPAIWGVPGMVWLALHPPFSVGKKAGQEQQRETQG